MPLDDRPYYLPGGAGGSSASRPPLDPSLLSGEIPGLDFDLGRYAEEQDKYDDDEFGDEDESEPRPRYTGTEEHLLEELHGLMYPGRGFKGFGGLDYLGTGYRPYVRTEYAPQNTVVFRGVELYRRDEIDPTVLDAQRPYPVEKIHFEPYYNIEDRHLDTLAACPHIMATLQHLELGDAYTATGGDLTDRAVQSFLAAAPRLRVLHLDACTDACTALTDATLLAALEVCPLLESVRITGHDKAPGAIDGCAAFAQLERRAALAPSLKELVLLDQDVDDAAAVAVTKARRGLAVVLGRTVGRGITARMVAAQGGGEPISTFYGGRLADMQVDDGQLGGSQWSSGALGAIF